jgi:hypothetical protein
MINSSRLGRNGDSPDFFMSKWAPGYILPNISVDEPFESSHYALVSCNDPRAIAIRRAHSEFDTFIRRFHDEFGHQVAPAVLFVQEGDPDLIGIEQASGFRDAVALSCVCKARALRLVYPHSRAFQFSSWFDFHPWMTSTNYAGIVGSSPAFRDSNEAKNFHGHQDASVPHTQVSSSDADNTLLPALLGMWDRRFITHPNAWRSIALFRSLNMAYAASQLPSGPDMTHYALGRSVGLWISAFEILVHPGQNGDVGYRAIYELLRDVEWRDPDLTVESHVAYAGRNKIAPNTLPCWIYGELFRARNDFLHGKPIALDRLVVQSSGQNLYNFAAPLYRAALTAFLGLKKYGPHPQSNDAIAKAISSGVDFNHDQMLIERALMRVFKPAQR